MFTGDIGWNQPEIPESICAGLNVLGLSAGLDTTREHDAVISPPESAVPTIVVRPREELQMAALAVDHLDTERSGR